MKTDANGFWSGNETQHFICKEILRGFCCTNPLIQGGGGGGEGVEGGDGLDQLPPLYRGWFWFWQPPHTASPPVLFQPLPTSVQLVWCFQPLPTSVQLVWCFSLAL
jgi:hypothetical protein